MSNKKLTLALVAVAIIAIGGYFFPAAKATLFGGTSCNGGNCTDFDAVNTTYGYYVGGTNVVDSSGNWVGNISAASDTAVVGTFTQGGGITASSTSASVTMAGTEFTTSNVLDYTVNVGTTNTLTWSASTTAPCSVMSSGQVRTVYIRNASTTAIALTIAGGTGNTLKSATSTVIAGNTDGSNMARFDITKKSSTNCNILMSVFN